MSAKKWKRRSDMQDDNDQTRLTHNGNITLSEPYKVEMTVLQDYRQVVFCPFCLHYGELRTFLISTKKGISQSLAACPECKQGMRMSTLVADMTPEQFADFVYPYAKSGFWKKVNFAQWNDRLRRMGWSFRFWARYKELKGEGEYDSEEAYLERKQREEHNRADE
jgi:hypothetical protein